MDYPELHKDHAPCVTDRGREVMALVQQSTRPLLYLAQMTKPLIEDQSLFIALNCMFKNCRTGERIRRCIGVTIDRDTEYRDALIACNGAQERLEAAMVELGPDTPASFEWAIARDIGVADPQRPGFQLTYLYFYRAFRQPGDRWDIYGFQNFHDQRTANGLSAQVQNRRTFLPADAIGFHAEMYG